jgi:arylsulfatase
VRQQKALMPDKLLTTRRVPPRATSRNFKGVGRQHKGKFDAGWDTLRKEIFARQLKLGVIPADAVLTERPAEIPAFDDMPRRQADSQTRWRSTLVPRAHRSPRRPSFDALKDLEVLDDTLISAPGDNGASAEACPMAVSRLPCSTHGHA